MTKQSIISKLPLLLLLIAIVSPAALAVQTVSESAAVFKGLILDAYQGRIPGASVAIESDGRKWNLRSDDNGEFKIELPRGAYNFMIEKAGFKKLLVPDFTVKAGAEIAFNFSLDVGPCSDCDGDLYGPLPEVLPAPLQPVNFSPLVRPLPAPQSAPNIVVTGTLTPSVKTGRAAKGTITIDIPAGYHINSSHPLEEFLVATKLTVEAPQGIRVGPIVYPPPQLRTFKFSKNKLSVYEGKVVLRFSLTVPASVAPGTVEMKAKLRYQSCNDSLCFPPKNIDVDLALTIN